MPVLALKQLRSALTLKASWHRSLRALGWLSLLAGCSTGRVTDTLIGSGYHPTNVYCEGPMLPAGLRRVAVLPLARAEDAADLAAGQAMLAPVLGEELAKNGKFEVVPVSPSWLQEHTSQTSWRADEKLPADFFHALKEAYGCDAVLFSQLTVFRAYPPLAIGWRLKLVADNTNEIVWAADEVFDAGRPSVVNGARRHQQEQQGGVSSLLDSQAILSSPRRFGHYAASTLLATLPGR